MKMKVKMKEGKKEEEKLQYGSSQGSFVARDSKQSRRDSETSGQHRDDGAWPRTIDSALPDTVCVIYAVFPADLLVEERRRTSRLA